MKKSHAGLLLSSYLLWGGLSVIVFIVFIALLLFLVKYERADMLHYFIALLFGFLWIGVTSISRHAFILLKKFIGSKISIPEFLSTQFVVLLFPLLYIRLKREVCEYEEKKNP
jgi:uncharacterized membrane protein